LKSTTLIKNLDIQGYKNFKREGCTMSATMRTLFVVFVLGLVLSPDPVFAVIDEPEPTSDPFYSEGNPFESPLHNTVKEHVDPFSGNLTLVHTDMHLPGNGGLDLNMALKKTSLRE
jgi:hypothetical protein